jgi:hypothetical protein
MIYQIKDLDTGVWDTNHFVSTEAAADYANDLIKRAVIRREKGHLAIMGGNKTYVEYITTGIPWFT